MLERAVALAERVEELEQRIPASDVRTFTGPIASLLFCNTAGFHRGGFSTTKPRVLATATYSSPASLASLTVRSYTYAGGLEELDAMDFMLYAMAIGQLRPYFVIDDAMAGLLGTITLAMSAVGGILFGFIADRIGRTRALMGTILIFSLASLGAASGLVPTVLVVDGPCLGGPALVLGLVGVYAVLAYAVSRRTASSAVGRAAGANARQSRTSGAQGAAGRSGSSGASAANMRRRNTSSRNGRPPVISSWSMTPSAQTSIAPVGGAPRQRDGPPYAEVVAEVAPRCSLKQILVTAVGDFLSFPKSRIVNYVVRQKHGKGFVADQFLRHQHRMAQPQRLLLPDIRDVDHVGDFPHHLQQIGFALLLQNRFQLEADVEMILDGVFAATGDDDDVVHPRGQRFLHAVLNDRLVHQRQHFLGLRLGRG